MQSSEILDPAVLLERINSFRFARIVLTANELGIFDTLTGGPLESEKVAELTACDPRATDRLMNALVSAGLLIKQAGKFSNTAFGARFLVRSSPAYLGGLDLTNATWKTWSTLTDAVRKGTTVAMDSHINDRPAAWQESFIAAMHARAAQPAREVAEALRVQGPGRILDVGGGSGIFAFEMVRRDDLLKATVFDLPAILPITIRYIREAGMEDRVDAAAGNYLSGDFGTGFDLVFMSAIVHINNPEENALLIRKGAEALKAGGRLVVLDHIMSEDRTSPAVGAFFALNMLVGTRSGDTYTLEEIRQWMHDAGLTDIGLTETPGGQQLVTGHKPG